MVWITLTLALEVIASLINLEMKYLSIPKLQWCSGWSLGMDEKSQRALYWTRDNLFMLGLMFIHVSKKGTLNNIFVTSHHMNQRRPGSAILLESLGRN